MHKTFFLYWCRVSPWRNCVVPQVTRGIWYYQCWVHAVINLSVNNFTTNSRNITGLFFYVRDSVFTKRACTVFPAKVRNVSSQNMRVTWDLFLKSPLIICTYVGEQKVVICVGFSNRFSFNYLDIWNSNNFLYLKPFVLLLLKECFRLSEDIKKTDTFRRFRHTAPQEEFENSTFPN